MSRLEQDEVGSCSFVDVLEEAVLVKRPVAIELRDGTTFIDQVTDVTTESGQDFAVFRSHARVPVRRSRPPRAPSRPAGRPTRSLTAETGWVDCSSLGLAADPVARLSVKPGPEPRALLAPRPRPQCRRAPPTHPAGLRCE